MWNKIYLTILAAAILAMGVLLYLPFSWLQSIGAPTTVRDNYLYYSNIGWMFLLVSSLILLIAGNVVLENAPLLGDVDDAFILCDFYDRPDVLARKFFLPVQTGKQFRQRRGFLSPLSGAVLIALAAIIVFFNQYLVKRLLDKTYPPVQSVESLPEALPTDEKNI